MAIKKRRPITPAQRFRTTVDFSDLSKERPEKSLIVAKTRINGRNNTGRITMRRRGGGTKKFYRLVDFRRNKIGVPAKVARLEYDPNRSAHIALLNYADGEKRYILAPQGLVVGSTVVSGPAADIKVGNALPLQNIPVGEVVHNIEMRPGAGGAIARGAGASAQLMGKLDKYALLRLPSGEQRKVLLTCYASVGAMGNAEHANRSIGKAGATRWAGRRPKVRGVAMNPVDHPHGGGEGKTSGGRHPVSPWGTPAKGYKTRHSKRTDKFIVRRRK